MGYIKKLKNNELVGGTDKTTIYPVTSTEAVFEEITNGNESSFKSQKTINKEQQDELDDHEERIQAAEVEDIKSITINGSTKKFKVDSDNNVDLTIYTVDSDPDMPSIADNVRDLRDVVGTSEEVLPGSHKTRIETLEGGESVTGSVENKIKTKVDSINSSYQDDNNEYVKYSMTQISGKVTNFNIDETSLRNAITSLNTSISGDNIVIRSGSTPSGTGEAGKIYRYVNSSNNTYTDYMYSGGSWVTLAIHDTSDEQSQVAYYTCTATGSGAQATKQFVSNGSLEYTPSSGGHIKILMGEANAATGTIYLQFGTTTSTKKPLYYNGEPASASNTWEAGETIAVYYDPSANSNTGAYFASNVQGGGGKAEKIKYNNSQSGLSAENVQEAVDEVAGDVELLQDSIGDVSASETPISMTWAQGTIQTGNGRETSSVKGLRTNTFILVSNDVKITTQEGYYIKRIYQYNTTGMSGDTPTDYVGVLYDGYSGGTWDSTVREFLVSKDNYLGKYIKVIVGNVTDTEITVQESSNISLCYVTYGIGGETIAEKLQELDASTYIQRTIHPTLEYGRLSPSRGGMTEWSNAQGGTGTPYFSNSIRTSLFIDVSKNKSISVTTSIDCQFKVVYYYPNYTLLGDSGTEFIVATSGTPTTVEIPDGARYIKIFFQKEAVSQNVYIQMFNLDIVGFFSEVYEMKNIRNVDDGFQHLAVKVAKVDPSSAYGVSNTVQDELQYGIDHGILALPESYTNDGKPTRLIIYCHGAAVNYAGDGTRFDSTDLIPEYWLSEGYAIMDMDGELSSTDSQQHTYVPESIECYVAAYNWIVRNYNIYNDGILLGGRSQGGGMCFYIMQSVIPVIAACPLVPVCNWLWWWSYVPSSYKSYLATNAGFIGTQPTWSSNKKLTSAEINYLRSNFTAYRRYSPFWRMIVDLPTDAQVLIPDSYVGVLSTEEDEPEGLEELFNSLHARACCPVKFFDNDKDTTVPYKRNALLMYNMLINSAQDAEFRMFNIDNDVDTSKTAHHFELRTDRVITYTNSRGVTLQNVPIVYIEMLTFWRRYEQNI